MQRPSSAMFLSALLVLSWLGFFASRPHAAQETASVRWSYNRVEGEDQLASQGKDGWEAYAVRKPDGGGLTLYYLKKRL